MHAVACCCSQCSTARSSVLASHVTKPYMLGIIRFAHSLALVVPWTQVSNLLLAAGPTHAWYRRHFEDYPAARRAIIPYVY